MKYLWLPILLLLAGCGDPIPSPIVDMHGVDPAKYNQDLAECHQIASNTAFAFGNPVTDCMKGRGYKILYSD